MKIIATNRKALRDYNVLENLECGIELKGSEVKSLRDGGASLIDGFARIERGEVLLYNVYIKPYEQTGVFSPEPRRSRRLLLHKKEIHKLSSRVSQKGFTLIPLRLYFSERGLAKVELALCRGKKRYDRREALKRRETELEIRRALKSKSKYR